MIYWPAKAPNEVEDFAFDFVDVLQSGETIDSKTVTATGVTVDSSAISGTQVQVWLSAGALGTPGVVTCTIVTSDARTYSEQAVLFIGEEPVTIAEARAQVNIIDPDDTTYDTFLASLIPSARVYVERCTRYFWVPTARTETFGAWGDFLEIYRRPIASVDSITYGPAGDDTDYTGFVAPVGRFPLRIYPAADDSFPDLNDGEIVTVTYTSGTLDATSEEYLIGKRAMLLLIGFWFENRGEVPLDKDTELALEYALDELRPVSAY